MPNGGKLEIVTENVSLTPGDTPIDLGAKPGPYVLLRVSDTGTGIPPDLIEKIFDPFFTTKELGKGTGLGLSTVMGIVRSHGAYINVASDMGKGSTFSVYFPAIPANKAAQEAAAGPDLPRGNGELILVVDDERAIRDVVRETLEMHGYRVLTASNGNEAVTLFLKNRAEVKLVLTDMMMPIMDGTSAIGALQSLEPGLPVIASSGLAVNGKPPPAAANLDVAFLPKPYRPDSLLKLMREKLTAT
jgi:CheY-like chemotaxis protein